MVDEIDNITDVDTTVHLLRHRQGETTSYFVIVKCLLGDFNGQPDERVLLVRDKKDSPTAGGISQDQAADQQMAVGQLLINYLVARKCLTARFEGEKGKVELLLDLPDSDYYLRPIKLADKHMATLQFFNEHHALAYASEVIDAMVHHETDWTKMLIKDNSMTL